MPQKKLYNERKLLREAFASACSQQLIVKLTVE